FVRVDVVIAPVVDDDLEINHWISCQITARSRLDDAFLDRRDEVPRDRAAKDFAGKFESAAAWHWLHANFAIAKLPVTAGLFLMASLRICLAANRFAIRNFRRLQRN